VDSCWWWLVTKEKEEGKQRIKKSEEKVVLLEKETRHPTHPLACSLCLHSTTRRTQLVAN
jgi:hypothetical protein